MERRKAKRKMREAMIKNRSTVTERVDWEVQG